MKKFGDVMKQSADHFAKKMIVKQFPKLEKIDFDLRELCHPCEVCGRYSTQYFEIRYKGKMDWTRVPIDAKFCIPCENKTLANETLMTHKRRQADEITSQFWKVPAEIKNETLATYKPEDPDQMEALKTAIEYAKDFQNGEIYSLLFRGTYGGGKSHLLKGVADKIKAMTKKDHEGDDIPLTVGFVTMDNLLDMVKGTFGRREGETEDSIIDKVIGLDFLVIDDLGTESGEWAGKQLFKIVNGRLGKATAFTTNFMDDEELARRFDFNGGKIVSRLQSNTKIVDVITKDMRQKKKRG